MGLVHRDLENPRLLSAIFVITCFLIRREMKIAHETSKSSH